MVKPFYQGKLDVFCAIYAVINGLRLTHKIHTLKGRDILNNTLFELAGEPKLFRAVLDQKTDYVFLVDRMLARIQKKYPLEVARPFGAENLPDAQAFWQTCQEWLNPNGAPAENRAIVCRFCRYHKLGEAAIVKHWTTVAKMDDTFMNLFDSSHEADSIRNIRRDNIAVAQRDVDAARFLHMQPDTARFLRLPF